MNLFIKKQKGVTVVELIVAIGILTAFVVSISVSYSLLLRLAFANVSNIKATLLAEETIEVVKFLKTTDWDANIGPISAGHARFLNFNGSTWVITNQYSLVDGVFERKFVLENVRRNSSGVIVEAPAGELDSDTKKITAYVSWQKDSGATTTKTMATYISKLK